MWAQSTIQTDTEPSSSLPDGVPCPVCSEQGTPIQCNCPILDRSGQPCHVVDMCSTVFDLLLLSEPSCIFILFSWDCTFDRRKLDKGTSLGLLEKYNQNVTDIAGAISHCNYMRRCCHSKKCHCSSDAVRWWYSHCCLLPCLLHLRANFHVAHKQICFLTSAEVAKIHIFYFNTSTDTWVKIDAVKSKSTDSASLLK